jgi:hypothetical protein
MAVPPDNATTAFRQPIASLQKKSSGAIPTYLGPFFDRV